MRFDILNSTMHVAIVGGGITGLTAAYELVKRGVAVTLFEKDQTLGGLVNGFSGGSWDWTLEKTYHHFFTNDLALLHLAKELGMKKDLLVFSPETAVFWQGHEYPFDTPLHILQFPGLPFFDRVRTGATAAIMKINPFWKPLERVTAKAFFKRVNGTRTWETIWEPLLNAKFGPYADTIAASWLWARLHTRTIRLGYIRGGFSHFVAVLAGAIKQQGGVIKTNATLPIENRKKYDAILLTCPSENAVNVISFDQAYARRLLTLSHLASQTLVLETTKPVLKKAYWLNVNDASFPFLAVVAHTNMIDKKHYGKHHITYIGNYLPPNHANISKSKEELLALFMPYIQKIAPSIKKKDIANTYLFTAPNAQPVHMCNYSTRAPTMETPIPGVYIANLDSIYPWDRGTNYAVDLGRRAAKKILSQQKSL